MKIEIGYWRCRNGSRARVLCTDAPGGYPVVGYLIDEDGDSYAASWMKAGHYVDGLGERHHDLIEPWKDEPEPEKPIEVTLSQIRKAAQLVARRVNAGLPANIDGCLVEVGISVPRPPTKQPVRVSGWCIVHGNGHISGVYGDRYAAEANARAKSVVVYVTGTEGVGPEEGDQ